MNREKFGARNKAEAKRTAYRIFGRLLQSYFDVGQPFEDALEYGIPEADAKRLSTALEELQAEFEAAHYLTSILEGLRSRGWMVAIHNDYRLKGKNHTFWLFTKDGDSMFPSSNGKTTAGKFLKGEGLSDLEALKACLLAEETLDG